MTVFSRNSSTSDTTTHRILPHHHQIYINQSSSKSLTFSCDVDWFYMRRWDAFLPWLHALTSTVPFARALSVHKEGSPQAVTHNLIVLLLTRVSTHPQL